MLRKPNGRLRWTILTAFIFLSLLLLYYCLPLPAHQQIFQLYSLLYNRHSPADGSRDVEQVTHTMYHVHFRPVHSTDNCITWQSDLISSMQQNQHWNQLQIEQLLTVLRRDVLNKTTAGVCPADQNPLCLSNIKLAQCQLRSGSSDETCAPISIGGLPVDLSSQPAMSKTFDDNNPSYNLTEIYWKPRKNASLRVTKCSITDEKRRRLLHDTLQHWIRFADEQHIWWTLSFGSLLGSIRNENIIPYDTDMDIFVLGTDEQKIRQLATPRINITLGKFNLVTRPGAYCDASPGDRIDCAGNRVQSLQDTCSFCGPLARMFIQYGNYIDIFLINMELHTNTSAMPTAFGYVIEQEMAKGLLDLSMLVPLKTCRIMGLTVPCPQRAEQLLKTLYGPRWRQPQKWCNRESGQWESVP